MSAQQGVVGREQLRAIGLSGAAIDARLGRSRLFAVHHGVYAALPGPLQEGGRWRAALLAAGPRAVLSHRTAAALWGLGRVGPRPEVIVPGRAGRRRVDHSLVVHRPRSLPPEDRDEEDGFAVTSVPRTLVDLAAVTSARELEKAVDQVELGRLLPVGALERTLDASAGRPGVGKLRAILDRLGGPTLTRSELEERFLALCRRAGLPAPRVNAWIALPSGGLEVDFFWPAHGLVVEVDGFASHGTRRAFGQDRSRDRRLRRAGLRVERFTWTDVVAEAASTRRELVDLVGVGAT